MIVNPEILSVKNNNGCPPSLVRASRSFNVLPLGSNGVKVGVPCFSFGMLRPLDGLVVAVDVFLVDR